LAPPGSPPVPPPELGDGTEDGQSTGGGSGEDLLGLYIALGALGFLALVAVVWWRKMKSSGSNALAYKRQPKQCTTTGTALTASTRPAYRMPEGTAVKFVGLTTPLTHLNGTVGVVRRFDDKEERYAVTPCDAKTDETMLFEPSKLVPVELSTGTPVRVHRFDFMKDLNGRTGVVERYDDEKDAYVVRLDKTGDLFTFPQRNLVLAPLGDLEAEDSSTIWNAAGRLLPKGAATCLSPRGTSGSGKSECSKDRSSSDGGAKVRAGGAGRDRGSSGALHPFASLRENSGGGPPLAPAAAARAPDAHRPTLETINSVESSPRNWPERRLDNGEPFTRDEFVAYYGGTAEWERAEPAPSLCYSVTGSMTGGAFSLKEQDLMSRLAGAQAGVDLPQVLGAAPTSARAPAAARQPSHQRSSRANSRADDHHRPSLVSEQI